MQIPEIMLRYKGGRQKTHRITNSQDAFEMIRNFFNRDTIEILEEFLVIYFDANNQALGWFRVSQGGISSSVVDPRIVFGVALKAGASAMVVAHNHPSGNLEASSQDIAVTEKLVEGGKILGIAVLDHLIVSADGGYLSFADQGLM